jgi:hypothetical protein
MSGRLRTFPVNIISIIFKCTIKDSFVVPHKPNFYICYRHTSTYRSAIIIIIPYHTGIKHSTMICEQSVIHIFDYIAYCKYQDLLFIGLHFWRDYLFIDPTFLRSNLSKSLWQSWIDRQSWISVYQLLVDKFMINR